MWKTNPSFLTNTVSKTQTNILKNSHLSPLFGKGTEHEQPRWKQLLFVKWTPPWVSCVITKAQIYHPAPLHHVLYLPPHSTPLHEICSSYVSPPLNPSNTLWSAGPAEVGGNLPPLQWQQQQEASLSCLRVEAQFSPCSLSAVNTDHLVG